MVTKKKLAIFDFCDTLFDGQSISYFLDFLEAKLPIHKKVYSKIRKRLNPISSSESKRYKEYLLKIFVGMRKSKFDENAKEFYEDIVKNRIHKQVIEKLYEHKNQGDVVVIVSGGFENYLKYFVQDYKIEHLFCTQLEFKNDKFTSKILGIECLGEEKVNQIKKLDMSQYDLENSFVYSDHHSDMPLFSLVGNKIVVKNRQKIDWINDSFKIMDINHA